VQNAAFHVVSCKAPLEVEVEVNLRPTVSRPVCPGVKFTLELVTRYYFLSESCCVVSVGRPL
jgi:hypothetical protein